MGISHPTHRSWRYVSRAQWTFATCGRNERNLKLDRGYSVSDESGPKRDKQQSPEPKAPPSKIVDTDAEVADELMDVAEPESIRELLETPVVTKFVDFLRESTTKQADLARQQADRAFELQKQQLELQAVESEREHEIEQRQLELSASHGRRAVWVVLTILLGLGALFVAFRDTPEVAIEVAKLLVALVGAAGIGWSFRKAARRHGD